MAADPLSQLVSDVLRRAGSTEAGAAELRRFNHVFQFVITDGAPFVVTIQDGAVTVAPGEIPPRPYEEQETVRTDAATLRALFEGRGRLVDLGWEGKLLLPLYGPKMHITAWLNRLVKIAHGQPVKLAT